MFTIFGDHGVTILYALRRVCADTQGYEEFGASTP